MKSKQNFRFILLYLLAMFCHTTFAQFLSRKYVKQVNAYENNGKGPKNYLEEIGGYRYTIDASKLQGLTAPFELEMSFYREPDVLHPLYTDSIVHADFRKLVPLKLSIGTQDNKIYTGAWSSDPNAFKESEVYSVYCKNIGKVEIDVPLGWCVGDFFCEIPDSDFTISAKCFVYVNVLSNNKCHHIKFKETPFFPVFFSFNKNIANTYEYLGDEDLSSLLENDSKPRHEKNRLINVQGEISYESDRNYEPLQITGSVNIIKDSIPDAIPIPIPIPDSTHNSEPVIVSSDSPHKHHFQLCSHNRSMKTEKYNFNTLYPETVTIPIGEEMIEWSFYSNDSISVGYVMKNPVSEILWMNIMKNKTVRQYNNPQDIPVANIQPYELDNFVATIENNKPTNFMYDFSYVEGVPQNIVAIPNINANIGRATYKECYVVHVYRTYCCSCGDNDTFHSIYRFSSKNSAERFMKK